MRLRRVRPGGGDVGIGGDHEDRAGLLPDDGRCTLPGLGVVPLPALGALGWLGLGVVPLPVMRAPGWPGLGAVPLPVSGGAVAGTGAGGIAPAPGVLSADGREAGVDIDLPWEMRDRRVTRLHQRKSVLFQ